MRRFFTFTRRLLAAAALTAIVGTAASAAPVRLRQSYIKHAPSDANILGNIYGVCNAFQGQQASAVDYARSFWGKIDFNTLEAQPLYTGIDFCNYLDQEHQTGAVRDGILYIPEGRRSNVRDFEVVWKRFDLASGRWLQPFACGDDMMCWMQTMCYDPVTDSFFGMTGNDDNGYTTFNRIVQVKLTGKDQSPLDVQWLADYPATPGNVLCGFFYNSADRTVCSLRDDGTIVEIHRDTAVTTPVAELYCADPDDENAVFAAFEDRGSAYLTYSPKDDIIIMVARDIYDADKPVYVYGINRDEGAVERIGRMKLDAMMTTLTCTDSYARPDAPAETSVKLSGFAKAALSGSFEVTAPTTRYNGTKLEGVMAVEAVLDGKTTLRQTSVAPGQTVEFSLQVAEGEHRVVSVAFATDDNHGPETVTRFYAGHDNPCAPEGLRLSGSQLEWDAVEAVGLHGGYVDAAAVTYDVYFDGKKQNAAPITATSFTFTPPATQTLTSITVTASASGKTSPASEPLEKVIGEALALPYVFDGSEAAASLFTVPGAEARTSFVYDPEKKEFVNTYENYEGSDSWLILPAIKLPSDNLVYELTADFFSYTPYYGTENISLWIGTEPDPAKMTRCLMTWDGVSTGESAAPMKLSSRFAVNAKGPYYLALHTCQPEEGSGSRISGLQVRSLNYSTAVPATPDNFKVEAAPLGELNAVATMTLPTRTLGGQKLGDQVITVHMEGVLPGSTLKASATGRPGETVTFKCPAENGFNSYALWLSNVTGHGCQTGVRRYVGIDIPNPVTGLRHTVSADNRSMTLHWDGVTEGVNGGYIDPANMRYQVWYNTSGVTWQRVGEGLKETSAMFDPNYDQLYKWRLTVMPENSAGYKKAYTVNYVEETLGVPHGLPVIEAFGTSGAAYGWSYNRTTPETENSYMRQVLNDELPLLDVGSCRFDDGAGCLVSTYYPGPGQKAVVSAPKFSTKGMKHPTLAVKIWDYELMPSIKVLARKHSAQTPVEIGSFQPEGRGAWRDLLLELPAEYRDEPWVELRLEMAFGDGTGCYALIDGVDIYESIEHDFKLISVEGPADAHVGDTAEFEVTVLNAGQEDGKGEVRVEVTGDGQTLHSESYAISRLRSFRRHVGRVKLEAKVNYLAYKEVKVKATAVHADDGIPANDSAEALWTIIRPMAPVVSDLRGEIVSASEASLQWSDPDYGYGSFDDFEYLEPFDFGSKLGQWTNHDADGFAPYAVEGLTEAWPGFDQARAWQVISAEALGTDKDARLCAHSGDRFLCAMAAWDPENPNKQVKTADWLISPEVKGGTEVKFWLNNISPNYQETLHVMVSTTDSNPASFTKLRNISKSGAESWEQASFVLPADARYFALVYVGWDTLGILIDDMDFSPVEEERWSVGSYEVWRRELAGGDAVKIAEVSSPSYTDKDFSGEAAYHVVTLASVLGHEERGADSNEVILSVSGVEEVKAPEGIRGVKGGVEIVGHDGDRVEIHSAEGLCVWSSDASSPRFTVPLDMGVYTVSVSGATAKILVK